MRGVDAIEAVLRRHRLGETRCSCGHTYSYVFTLDSNPRLHLAKQLSALVPDLGLEERHTVLEWMIEEWEYSNVKFGLIEGGDQRLGHDESMRVHGFTSLDPEAFWFRQVTQYFKRAELLDVTTWQGRQALMKSLMTLFDCCASMIRMHGLPPKPGMPSGEIKEWVR